jgi:hypothetical protein
MNMRPDNSLPMTVGTDGVAYPNNYFNEGPCLPTLDLIQKNHSGSTTIDGLPTAVGNPIFKFQDPTATSGNDVLIRLWTLKPDKSKTTTVGTANVRRTYMTIMKDENEPAFTIAAT